MAGVWYDSRGRKWDPRTESEAADSDSVHAPALGSSPTEAPAEEQEPATLLPQRAGAGPRSGGPGAPPPDWVMEFLEGHAPAHVTRPTYFTSRPENAIDKIEAPRGAGARDDDGTHDDGPHHDEDEDEDDFMVVLERDLSKNRGSARSTQEPAGQWKVSPRDRSSRRAGDEEDLFAEQLAQELASAPASAGAKQPHARELTRAPMKSGKSGKPGNARRPTAAERQQQDDKWMQLSS